MSSEYRGPYIIRETESDGDGAEEWVAPEPAEQVIVEEVLAATDLSRGAIEPLDEHVNFDALEMVLDGEEGDVLSFEVEGYDISITHDGSIDVA